MAAQGSRPFIAGGHYSRYVMAKGRPVSSTLNADLEPQQRRVRRRYELRHM